MSHKPFPQEDSVAEMMDYHVRRPPPSVLPPNTARTAPSSSYHSNHYEGPAARRSSSTSGSVLPIGPASWVSNKNIPLRSNSSSSSSFGESSRRGGGGSAAPPPKRRRVFVPNTPTATPVSKTAIATTTSKKNISRSEQICVTSRCLTTHMHFSPGPTAVVTTPTPSTNSTSASMSTPLQNRPSTGLYEASQNTIQRPPTPVPLSKSHQTEPVTPIVQGPIAPPPPPRSPSDTGAKHSHGHNLSQPHVERRPRDSAETQGTSSVTTTQKPNTHGSPTAVNNATVHTRATGSIMAAAVNSEEMIRPAEDDRSTASMLHRPCSLPKFRDPQLCMWTASHAANNPSEDRSSSLVNVLLQPLPPNFDSETQLPPLPDIPNYPTLIRLNLWSVIDGHGGGCVATYASEVLLPHIAASVSRALGCAIVDRGVCTVNGQLRDANALDLDGLIQVTSVPGSGELSCNPNSIHYRSPYERSDSEDEDGVVVVDGTNNNESTPTPTAPQQGQPQLSTTRTPSSPGASVVERGNGKSMKKTSSSASSNTSTNENLVCGTTSRVSQSTRAGSSPPPRTPRRDGSENGTAPEQDEEEVSLGPGVDASVSSVKTSVKTAASLTKKPLVGTHSPNEVAAITRAITESFLAVDEGWINSIDPLATHQTSCQSNGRWNSGACALVVFTIQRLDWTSVSEPDREKESRGPDKSRRNTSQNRDAARRRMLDNATRTKSASSISTVSSTSSLTTEEAVHASGLESEITETEEEEDEYDIDRRLDEAGARRRNHLGGPSGHPSHHNKESLISPPGGCSCHCYRAHDAFLYSAHVGDCRAVMLGSAPPRTIKVRGGASANKSPSAASSGQHNDFITTDDDESSHHSSDETECLSSSDHDADSSEDEDYTVEANNNTSILTTANPVVGSAAVSAAIVAESGKNTSSKSTVVTTSTVGSSSGVTSVSGNSATLVSSSGVASPSLASSTAVPSTTSTTTTTTTSAATTPYRMIPRRVVRQRGMGTSSRRESRNNDYAGPFRPLPPLILPNPHPQATSASPSNENTPGTESSMDQHRSSAVDRNPRSLATRADDNSTSSAQTRDDESSSDGNDQLPLFHLPPPTRPIDLTTDHSAYNPAEVTAVLRRCNNAPRAISAGVGGGIKRVAGSLAVTRALGDAYLKTPLLSFNPYKSHAPYITARPEVNCRPLVKDLDKVLILSTDGVWERASGEDVLRWVRNFYEERVAEMERRRNNRRGTTSKTPLNEDGGGDAPKSSTRNAHEGADRDLFETTAPVSTSSATVPGRGDPGQTVTSGDATGAPTATSMSSGRKRDHAVSSPGPNNNNKRRKRNARISYNVADVIVRRVLNKVRRARNISSLQALMSLPLGRARRSKHDDITSSVVDLSAFVS